MAGRRRASSYSFIATPSGAVGVENIISTRSRQLATAGCVSLSCDCQPREAPGVDHDSSSCHVASEASSCAAKRSREENGHAFSSAADAVEDEGKTSLVNAAARLPLSLQCSPLTSPLTTQDDLALICRQLSQVKARPGLTPCPVTKSHHVRAVSTYANSKWATTPCSFFLFPPEIRNIIYDAAMQWPNSRRLFQGSRDAISAHYRRLRAGSTAPFSRYSARMRTPTILLLCRAVTVECLPVLRARTLVIDSLPPWPPEARRPLSLSRFFGRTTLQNLRRIDIRVSLGQGALGSGWVWMPVLASLLRVLMQKNRFEWLRILIKLHDIDNWQVWQEEMKWHQWLQERLDILYWQNPNITRPGVVHVEYWRIDLQQAYRVTPEQDAEGRLDLNQLRYGDSDVGDIRYYPDEELWQPSVLEFL